MFTSDGQQTSTEELTAAKDPGVDNATSNDQIKPEYAPSRIINLNDTKTLELLKQEKQTSPRLAYKGKAVDNPVFPELPGTVKILRGPNSSQIFYEGQGLIDENNSLVRLNKYDPASDILNEFFRIKNAADRNSLFTTMQKLNLYGPNNKPSQQALDGNGLSNNDYAAIESFMLLANNKGRTMSGLVDMYISGQLSGSMQAGSGRTVSVVSREDAAKQTGNSFFDLLGRAPTPTELKIAIQAIQSGDRSRQLSNIENPASLSVAAEQQAKKASPGEFGAYSAGKAINQIFSLLGGQ